MQTLRTGKEGEKLAAQYLEEKGYHILEGNYRHKRGEIDLIVRKEKLLVFVEVKTRSTKGFGFPEESVDLKKEEKILETAEQYLYEKNWLGPIRFDVISVLLNKSSKPEIEHFEDAFH